MYTRTQPYLARIKERFSLTKEGSSKKTFHIVLDIRNAHFPFTVGDSVGVIPQNDPQEIQEIVDFVKGSSQLTEFLTYKANINRVTSSFLKLYAPEIAVENLNEFVHSHSLLDILRLYSPKIHEEDLIRSLLPLMPRFYSIANSPLFSPGEIHLTVSYVEYLAHGRIRRGIGSHFLCNMAKLHESSIPIYIQPSNGFTLPSDPTASVIFVGPGTGVAPFRAFMQERLASHATGRNWLFFGERHRSTDFLYESFWMELEKQERLRLNLAFSRDSTQKCYVQHKMYEERKSLWNWIENGAYFYVCGDAEQMAKEVEAALRKIACEEGNMTELEARHWIKKLRSEKRYLTDVY